MENKYYTPEISEFYVGFEYEKKSGFMDGTVKSQEQYDTTEWIKETSTVGDSPYIERTLNGRNAEKGLCGIRVKYLDQEDIESLGWHEMEADSKYQNCYHLNRKKYTFVGARCGLVILIHDEFLNIIIIKQPNFYRDGTGNFDGYVTIIYKAEIKNKSELKKILKQIGI